MSYDCVVRPVQASYWDDVNRWCVEDPAGFAKADGLKLAFEHGHTIWIEGRLEGLGKDERKWFAGSLEAWERLPKIPTIGWNPFEAILKAVGLEPPSPEPRDGESFPVRLLRAIPYLYVQGTFGTVRDLFPDAGEAEREKTESSNDQLTAFPAVGFHPIDPASKQDNPTYTMVRTAIGVVEGVVVSVRLPDILCAESGEDETESKDEVPPLAVPPRFFPLWQSPNGNEVAKAIGIHQATSARAVAKQIRKRLEKHERSAKELNVLREERERSSDGKTSAEHGKKPADRGETDDNGDEGDTEQDGSDPRKEVIDSGKDMEKLSEITHQLDQQVARILRRFGGKVVDAPAPAKELVPREVKRRYRFALDDVRQLRDDCELVSEMVGETLARYDREQRERFQHIAAVLGACVLIPTLIASLFGVNFGVPGKENLSSFIAFVVAMFFLAGTGTFALLRAQKRDWHPRFWRDLAFPSGFAILIVAAFVAFLIWKS